MNGSFLGSFICCGRGGTPIYSRKDLMPFISITSPILSLGFAFSSHQSHIFLIISFSSVYGGSTLINGKMTHESSEPTTIGALLPTHRVAPLSPPGFNAFVILVIQCMHLLHSPLFIL